MKVLEDLFRIQEEILKPNNYCQEARVQIFKKLGENFKLVPCVNGVYTGEVVPKPSYSEQNDDSNWIRYKKYKNEVNKLKATIGKWDKQYPITPDFDKYALKTGNEFYLKIPNCGTNIITQCLFVIDIDDLNKALEYNSILKMETWEPTLTVKTGNGWHLIYLCPTYQKDLKSAVFKWLGIDIRSNGGYIIAPGSIHPGTRTFYEILTGKYNSILPEANFELAQPPEIMLKLSCEMTRKTTVDMIKNSCKQFSVPVVNGNGQSSETIYSFGYTEEQIAFMSLNENTTQSENIITQNEQPVLTLENQTESSPFKPNENDYTTYISNKIKALDTNYQKKIYEGNPNDRSNNSFIVKVYLISQGWSHDEIKYVFDNFKVGEKDREKAKYNFFEKQYAKALKHCLENNHNKNLLFDPKSDPVNEYGSITALELMNTKIDYPMIIDPFLMKQSKLLICAERGSCKTHMILQMITELLNPNRNQFLGTFDINSQNRPKSILYVNGENSIYELQMKIKNICKSLSDSEFKEVLGRFFVMTKSDYCMFNDRLNNDYFIEAIRYRVMETEADIVVIDNLQCYNKSEENGNSNMRNLLDNMTPILTEFDIPIILVHHSGKKSTPDEFARGASSIGDWCSHALYIQKNKDSFKLYNPKSRTSAAFTPLELSFNGEIFTPVTGTQSSSSSISYNQMISEVMKKHGNKFDKKGDLKLAVKNYLASIGTSMCSSKIDALITNAINSNIIKETISGKNNQKSYELV